MLEMLQILVRVQIQTNKIGHGDRGFVAASRLYTDQTRGPRTNTIGLVASWLISGPRACPT